MWIGMFLAINIFLGDQPISASIQQVWLHWDASWYLSVVTHGYNYIAYAPSSVVFFPVLPILIRVVGFVTGPITAGLLVANICTTLAYVLLYALVRLEFPDDEGIAKRTLLYMAFFPTAIYTSMIFTEPVMLLLTVAAFYFARRRIWSLSIAAAILAGATHATGVLIAIPVGLEWARAHGLTLTTMLKRNAWRSFFAGIRAEPLAFLAILLTPLGLISFIYYEYVAFGVPLLFPQVMHDAWGRFSGGAFAELASQLPAFVNLLLTGKQITTAWLFNFPLFVFTLPAVLVVWRRLGTSYGLFTLASILLPIASSPSGFSRYLSILFPFFMILAVWGKRSVVHQIIFAFFCVVLGIVIVTYISNIFVD